MPLKLLSRRRRRPTTLAPDVPVIIDFSSDAIILPSGKIISRDMILSIDAATGTIIYKDTDGMIREEQLRPNQLPPGTHTRRNTDSTPITYT